MKCLHHECNGKGTFYGREARLHGGHEAEILNLKISVRETHKVSIGQVR